MVDPGLIWFRDAIMVGDRLVFAKDEPAPRQRERNLWELDVDPVSGKPKGEARRLTDWAGFKIVGLSATADGSRLAFGNIRSQDDVFVGELLDGGRLLGTPQRLTLDDRDDMPEGWTPDGRSVVFQSDRSGTPDLFVQGLDERNPRELAGGAAAQMDSHLSPDGRWLLFWELEDESGRWTAPRRLLRTPIGGGPTELVHESPAFASLDCATDPDGSCLLSEVLGASFAMSRLDPMAGKQEELLRKPLDLTHIPVVALSPDGSMLAMVGYSDEDQSIRLQNALTGEVVRELRLEILPGLEFQDIEWSPDANGFYIVGETPRGVAIVRVDMQGEAHVLLEDETGYYSSVNPSPDGRYLAFGKSTQDVNGWMVEGF
ncbi:MAG: hypothetical protein R3344_07570, partial [Acidobacteriota bacterium]|nr:hypothetical protein [Acidobacteriota bacterium]